MGSKEMKPMLAGDYDGSMIRFPLYVQPKYDGIRILSKSGQPITRTLKTLPNKSIQRWFAQNANQIEGLDGEIIVGDPLDPMCYRKTASGCMSQDGEPDWTYHVFDIWDTGATFESRLALLKDEYPLLPDKVKLVPTELIISDEMLYQIEQSMVEAGHEGIITRSPHGLYKFGRATSKSQELLKLKRFLDAEALIIGFEERMHNANEAKTNLLGRTERSSHKENKVAMNTLGSLIVKMDDKEFKIGTGFDDGLRQQIWDNRDQYINTFAKFKYVKVGGYDVPRFPVFLGFRSMLDM